MLDNVFAAPGKRVKTAAVFLSVLALCLALCGCGKSEAVQNVEAMITAIGEVKLESEAAIVAAEEAYAALTPKEQEKVENYAVLTEARATLDPILEEHQKRLKYVGEWIPVASPEWQVSHVLFADGSLTENGKDLPNATWLLSENGIIIQTGFDAPLEWVYEEVDSISRLVHTYEDGSHKVWIRKEHASYTEHTINIDNWQEYFDYERVYQPHYDLFGTLAGFGYYHYLTLKPEYAERLVQTHNEYQVAVEFSGTQYHAYGQLDQETGEFAIEKLMTNFEPLRTVGAVLDWELDEYHLSAYYSSMPWDGAFPPNAPYCELGYLEDTVFGDDNVYGYLEDPGIGRIQGSLLFYDYPVHRQ